MVSKNLIKHVKSLQLKKFRQEYQAFLVEGEKSVAELLHSDFEIVTLLCTPTFHDNYLAHNKHIFQLEIATPAELQQAGTLQTNDAALAVVKTKSNEVLYANSTEYVLVLDDIRDPGNLGTIIRIADWYGIGKVVCSLTTTDFYNPKVIAASKGSFTRVKSFYTNLEEYCKSIIVKESTIYGAFLEGQSVHQIQFATSGYIVMGNESNGISEEIAQYVKQKITIPRYGQAESLNVGIATAIVLDNVRREIG